MHRGEMHKTKNRKIKPIKKATKSKVGPLKDN